MRLKTTFILGLVISTAALVGNGRAETDVPFLQGQVTDEQGRPIRGATVYIADCIGTCFGGTGRLTDENGDYIFEHKTFRNFPALSVSMPGRYEVSTDYRGPKLHEPDGEEPRKADFVLGTPAAVKVVIKGSPPKGWEQSVILRPGRDTDVRRYDLSGMHVVGWNWWRFAIVPRNEPYHVVVVQQPRYEPSDDPKEHRKRRLASRDKQVEILSAAIRFPDPMRFDLTLNLVESEDDDSLRLSFEKVEDVLRNDRRDELVVKDPLFGLPVDEALQQEARELLERVAKVAIPWNGGRPKDIASYEYEAVYSPEKRVPIRIDERSPSGPSWSDISRLRGFAYMPPLRWLFNQPENVVFYGVQIGEKEAELVYRLRESRRFSAGIGVGPSWGGFFSRSFSSGKIKIDPQRAVVLEHRLALGPIGEECIESFSDYVEIDGGFAPQKLRIQSDGFDFNMEFKVHEGVLWLLDKVERGDLDQSTYRIENVKVTPK